MEKFIVLEEIFFLEKHFTGTGSLSTKIVSNVIPENSELIVSGVKDVAVHFRFSNGYNITTTFERLQELKDSGAIRSLAENIPAENHQQGGGWCWTFE